MKKFVLLIVSAIILGAVFPLTAQVVPTKVAKGDYNQSELDRHRMQTLRMIENYQQIPTDYIQHNSPAPSMNKGFVNTFFLNNRFGVNTFYSYRVGQDMHLVGEFGYYFRSQNDQYPTIMNRINSRIEDVSNAMLFPMYFGVRHGFFSNLTSHFYPYIGAGFGPAVGVGYVRNDYNSSHYNFQLAPSGYLITGVELYTFKKMFFDLNVRYRHLKFGNNVADWNNFSGFSFALGFGYGFGGMQMLR
ncbi:hypothetical protein ACFL4Q_04865 [candidate division KSB1 bacterium]